MSTEYEPVTSLSDSATLSWAQEIRIRDVASTWPGELVAPVGLARK